MKYVPALANAIVNEGDVNFNFKSIGVGDPLVDPYTQAKAWLPYGLSLGILDIPTANSFQPTVQSLLSQIQSGDYEQASKNYYPILLNISSSSMTNIYQTGSVLYSSSYFASYIEWTKVINETSFRQKLGVFPRFYPTYGFELDFYSNFGVDISKPYSFLYSNLLKKNVSIFVYNGQFDWIIAPKGIDDFIASIIPNWNSVKGKI